ncbi:hypothetical protein Patl1_12123 [Pistacia atlantica]|uniref:Uncharacterized protein n=1 Tax=Pistacia atlantica TaxID=434234 RepID=A0ACC1A8Y3_9ROSI|nr:hypothetical protein Patl1_12123 [Pistacia atlantica]
MKLAEDSSQSESADKSHFETLMAKLTTIKYDGSRTMHELVIEMSNLAARLRAMGMIVDESFLVQFKLTLYLLGMVHSKLIITQLKINGM